MNAMESIRSGGALMKAVVSKNVCGQEVLQVQEVPVPELKTGEVLIKVLAIAVNEADIIERNKFGNSSFQKPFLGFECSGIIERVGKQVQKWKVNEEVCAILNGKGYAEMVAVPEGQVFPKPRNIPLIYAASLPLAACIVWSELFTKSKLSASFWLPKVGNARLSFGETILVQEDCSGIDKFVVQLARKVGASVYVKSRNGKELSNFKPDAFIKFWEQDVMEGVDVIFNCPGEKYIDKNLPRLKSNGRLISIGKCSLDTQDLFALHPDNHPKYFIIEAASFWRRTTKSIEKIVEEVKECVWPLIEVGEVSPPNPVRIFPFSKAAEAHLVMENSMETGKCLGKILLLPDELL